MYKKNGTLYYLTCMLYVIPYVQSPFSVPLFHEIKMCGIYYDAYFIRYIEREIIIYYYYHYCMSCVLQEKHLRHSPRYLVKECEISTIGLLKQNAN